MLSAEAKSLVTALLREQSLELLLTCLQWEIAHVEGVAWRILVGWIDRRQMRRRIVAIWGLWINRAQIFEGCRAVHMAVRVAVRVAVRMTVRIAICMTVRITICMTVRIAISMTIHIAIRMTVRLTLRLTVHMAVRVTVRVTVRVAGRMC